MTTFFPRRYSGTWRFHAVQQGQEALIGGELVCDASTDVSGQSLSVASPKFPALSTSTLVLQSNALFPISPRLNFNFWENLVSLHVG
jgi:hypothetical protein